MATLVQIYLLPVIPNQPLQFSVGTTLKFESVATDDGGDLKSHYVSLSHNREGHSWSEGILGGGGKMSIKGGSFTFTEEGTYTLRASCDTNSAPDLWVISNEITLSFYTQKVPDTGNASSAGTTPPVVVPPVVIPPVTPPSPPVYVPPPVMPTGPILAVPAFYPAGPIPIALFGDSLWTNAVGAGNPADLLAAAASTATGETVTLKTNQSIAGASSRYVVQTAGVLTTAVAAIVASGAKVTLIRFGANDSKLGTAVPASEYATNMASIAGALATAGQIVIVQYPLAVQLGAFGSWDQTSIDLLKSYLPMCDLVCNQTTIRQGNRSLFVHFTTHPDQQADGVHPWLDGQAAMANGDAMGIKYALKPVPNMPVIQNQDGSVNAGGYAAYWKTEDPRAWSVHFGPTWQQIHPDPTEDRDELYTKQLVYHNQIYDMLGEGSPVPPIDGSLQNPGHDMHPVQSAFQVYPYTDGPTNPAVAPTDGNFFFGLPNYCTDPNDPANANPDPAIRILLMEDHRQRVCKLNADYWQNINAGDYNSDFLTAVFHSEDRINHCGVDRAQNTASYNLCFALQPKRNAGGFLYQDANWNLYASIYKRQDPYGAPGQPLALALGKLPGNPIWSDRSNFVNAEEAWIDDAYGAGTTQPGPTSRDEDSYPVPAGGFLPGEVPGPFCISTMNEFKASCVWDTNRNVGKVVVFAMQGYGLKGHSPKYYGLSNEGSWSGCHRIDEFDLVDSHGHPMKFPTGIVMATDATLKPVQPDPGAIDLSDPGQRASYRNTSLDNAGIYSSFAISGCIGVISETENMFLVYSCTAFIQEIWTAYTIADQTAWNATFASMNAGTFPGNWQGGRASFKPTLVYSATVDQPSCLLASGGLTNSHFGDWSGDFEKILIGSRTGLVSVCSIAPFMDRYHFGNFWNLPVQIYGSFQVGRPNCNLTQMIWSRWDAYYGNVSSAGVMDANSNPVPFGQTFFACARADRAVYAMCTRFAGNRGVVGGQYRKITDKRIQDPTCICVGTRSPVLNIGDFSQNLVHGVQFGGVGNGAVYDSARGVTVYAGKGYDADPSGKIGWSYTGAERFAGSVFRINSDNINALIGLLSLGLAIAHSVLSLLA